MKLRVFKASNLIPTGDVGTVSPNAPLWHNPHLGKFCSREDGLFWAKYGIKTVAQLYGGSFKSFVDYQRKYDILATAYFRYLQIQHVAAAQFGLANI